jgi:glycosyltransferase involved in cell wall biosynthesis
MRPHRLCFVAPADSVHTKRWVEAMVARGHETLVVSTKPCIIDGSAYYNPYDHMGIWRIPKLHHPIAHWMMQRAIERFEPDLVHMHYLEATPWLLRLARRWPHFVISVWGRDVVWDADTPEPPARVERKRRMLALATEITATTHFLADQTRPFVPADRRIHVIPFGVETERFHPAERRPAEAPVVIGFMKHFGPKYGPDVMIRSMARVHREFPNARAVMYGDRDIDRYRRLVAELGLGEVVELRDAIAYADVPFAMRSFDILCMPSIFQSETFGVAAIEASACGVPVVATRVGGVPEAVDDGVTGLLVAPGDDVALADALLGLLRDPSRARAMGEAGRRFVLDRFEWDDNVTAMEGVYALVTGARVSTATGAPAEVSGKARAEEVRSENAGAESRHEPQLPVDPPR